MLGVPNHHLKTTRSKFGGSIFSGSKLKANTKMETDVKRASSSTLLSTPCFHPFSLSLSLSPSFSHSLSLPFSLGKHNEWGVET